MSRPSDLYRFITTTHVLGGQEIALVMVLAGGPASGEYRNTLAQDGAGVWRSIDDLIELVLGDRAVAALASFERARMRTLIWRTSRKLDGSPWLIERRYGSHNCRQQYRLARTSRRAAA